ncbi:phospholipase D-like domain-containing protein [Victivallis sp. Marseille-Q1083]|uniref:phospholipase D-like domain-containing protein n=1 Tax=Victivallis sp. Marseille-Q1083 TaxID=2717288 RepID=UPI00158C26F8|nr:phospholipase D-like domain-containing protein [Victivallis sp. Marseille-Q1083]
MIEFVSNRAIYEKVIRDLVPQCAGRLWIATADLKDMYVEQSGLRRGKMVPFLEVLAGLLQRGVEIRLIHAREPGPAFRRDFDRFPGLWEGLERVLCPRVHFKCVIVDGVKAYFGSANLTGAGMGAKASARRNFENGVLTDRPELILPLAEQFDEVWRGEFCASCGRREYCSDCPLAAD